MTAYLLISLLAVAETAPTLTRSEAVLLDRVWNALQSDTGLANHHRGYLAYLEAHPEFAAAEDVYSDLTTLSGFRGVVWAFDEALQRAPGQQDRYDRFCAALVKHEGVRTAVEALQDLEYRERILRRDGSAGLRYLRARPDEAIRFLERPRRLLPVPEPLRPLRSALDRDRDLRDELLARFRALDRHAAAHADVFPWWRTPGEDGGLADSHRRMRDYFARRAHQWSAWRRR